MEYILHTLRVLQKTLLLFKKKDIPSSAEDLGNLLLFLLIFFLNQVFGHIFKETILLTFLNTFSSQIKLFQIRSRSNIIACNLLLIFDDSFARNNVTNGTQRESFSMLNANLL